MLCLGIPRRHKPQTFVLGKGKALRFMTTCKRCGRRLKTR